MTARLRLISLTALTMAGLLGSTAAWADQYKYKIGVTKVAPRSKATDFQGSFTPPGMSLKIQNFNALTFSFYRVLNEHVDVELAFGIPPTASTVAKLNNPGLPESIQATNGQVASTLKLYTPAVYVNYNFGRPQARLKPYVGLGLNAVVSHGKSTPVNEILNLGPTEIIVSSSFGPAAQAGLSYWFNDDFAMTLGLAVWRNRSKITFITTSVGEPIDVRLSRSAYVRTTPLLMSFSLSGRF